jgi:hypothetical protein
VAHTSWIWFLLRFKDPGQSQSGAGIRNISKLPPGIKVHFCDYKKPIYMVLIYNHGYHKVKYFTVAYSHRVKAKSLQDANMFPKEFPIAPPFYPMCFGKCCPPFTYNTRAKGEGF